MLRLLLVACLAAAALAGPFTFDVSLDPHWESYKAAYGKNYLLGGEPMRRAIWESNLRYIRHHNLEADMGMHSYRLGVNEYADWSNEEFRAFMNGYQMTNASRSGSLFLAPANVQVPDEMDWRKEGYVTEVKNQEQCGSCWAFSTTGSLEGQHFKATGKLVSLSEQNLVDCSKKEGNMGCNGGLMDQGFEYIKSNGGIDTEDSYPYTAKDGTCHFKASDVGATCTGYTDIKSGDEDALKTAAGTVGPISVAIDAGHPSFQMYKTGVYDPVLCSSTRLDHGVLVVGYGSESGQDYWLVKNSWGKSWGMDGYIKMVRNKGNKCGIATSASYPLV